MTENTFRFILDENPRSLGIILISVLLPLGILLLTNRVNGKQKESTKSKHVGFNSKNTYELRKQLFMHPVNK